MEKVRFKCTTGTPEIITNQRRKKTVIKKTVIGNEQVQNWMSRDKMRDLIE